MNNIKFLCSLILGMWLLSTLGCTQIVRKDLIDIELIEPNLCEIVMFLDSLDFQGNIGFDQQTMELRYGLANNKSIQIPEKYIKTLQNYFPGGLIRGVVNNKQFTYFIVDGYFREGNYGILFSKADYFEKNDDVISCDTLRKSSCINGNWFNVETKL